MSSANFAGSRFRVNSRLHYITRDPEPVKRPLFRAKDFIILPAICCGSVIFGALTRPICIRLARRMAEFRAASFSTELESARFGSLGETDLHAAKTVLRRHMQERRVASALFLRSLVRGPAHEVELDGADLIEGALRGGKGVVLWVSDFVYAQDVAKIALSRAGYFASHLSQPEHGFSDSAFGVRILNPIRTRFESRFLRERIVFDRNEPGHAIQRLLQRLAENGIVSVTATAAEGRNLCDAAFLKGRLRIAPGAPKIAYRSGAPVLPVFIVPDPEAPRFRLVVEDPLKMDGAGEAAAVSTAVQDYVNRLEKYVLQRPEFWAGWDMVES